MQVLYVYQLNGGCTVHETAYLPGVTPELASGGMDQAGTGWPIRFSSCLLYF